jgi:hypothetical protein
MAIDTQTKRRSVTSYTGVVMAPVPDGTVGTPDRMQMAGLYPFGGGAPAIVTGGNNAWSGLSGLSGGGEICPMSPLLR